MNRAKCLVTGVAGFIGSNVAENLIKEGHEVVGVDNFFTGKRENIESFISDMHFVEGDIRNQDLLFELCRDVDTIFHLAALVSVPQSMAEPSLAHDINMNGTMNLLSAAAAREVRRVVFSSSAAIYGEAPEDVVSEDRDPAPVSPYALSKLQGEQCLQLFSRIYGLGSVSLRYFNVFGERQDPAAAYAAAIPGLLSRVLRGQAPHIFGDGEQTRDFVHVDDVVQANLLAMKAGPEVDGEVFNIASGKWVTLNALTQKMLELLDSDLQPEYGPVRAGDVKHSRGDISRAKKVLGFQPRFDALSGLSKTIDWYKENLVDTN